MSMSPPEVAHGTGATLEASANLPRLFEPYMDEAVAALDGKAPLLAGMVRYHLGQVDAGLAPLAAETVERGKRIRPTVALLSAAAAGGEATAAAPVAASLELLHNFTLIHDDIQDESLTRRHRTTVWRQWGIGQAINAGDALFAAAHLPLFRLVEAGAPAALLPRVIEAFDRMTIAIVEGQTLDLGFEGRDDVTPAAYQEMVAGKTAAIVRYAAWAGALLGGADEATSERFAAFGQALGIGFQMRDDSLGIWGETAATGKAPGDDVRRRKQSLPILLLRERADAATRVELDALYDASAIDDDGIGRVLTLLAAAGVQETVEDQIAALHDEARSSLLAAARPGPNPAREQLLALVDQLAGRAG